MIKEAIAKLVNGENLTLEEARKATDDILSDKATNAQISAYLTALRVKGETVDEIVGCAITVKDKASHIRPNCGKYVDFVGTGGDGTNTFNISTTAAFVIAAAGIPVAKHGNRAVSSKSGSADVLEKLGVNIMLEPNQVEDCIEKAGIGFMFARTFNKSMKNVGAVRSELGVRTVFNVLGPLSNPSDASMQIVGVYDRNLTNPLANVMLKMGVERGMVVNGISNGMDEISTISETAISEIKDGTVTDYIISPEEMGLKRAKESEILGGTAEENAEITISILKGEKGAKRDIVLLNSAAAFYCGGKAESLKDGINAAAEIIDSGKAYEKYRRLVEVSNSF